jgi:hypothetical protein
MPTKYKVLVDDNYHCMDEDERTEQEEFDTAAQAVAACKKIVDDFLTSSYQPGMSAAALYDGYTGFGEDPFIVGGDPPCKFSAWEYARQRCAEICQS